VLRDLREEYGGTLRTALMNVAGRGNAPTSLIPLFDFVYSRANYAEAMTWLAAMYINVDLPPDYTYGRGIVDAAVLGVPTVGSRRTSAMHILFPELIVDPSEDDAKVREMIRDLLEDPEFASKMATQGMRNADYFSLKNSYHRMVAALEEDGLI